MPNRKIGGLYSRNYSVAQIPCFFISLLVAFAFGIKDVILSVYADYSFTIFSPVLVYDNIADILIINLYRPIDYTAVPGLRLMAVAVIRLRCGTELFNILLQIFLIVFDLYKQGIVRRAGFKSFFWQ